jgi:SAM-dependent methyltransferase
VRYPGSELPLFVRATNFHRYYLQLFGPRLRGRVLEVGAGMGTVTAALLDHGITDLTVCEPDRALAANLADRFGPRISIVSGGLADVPSSAGAFDAILYVDVLEHIDDDVGEVRAATARLADAGGLLIGGPAHGWLYSPFDAAIGHKRRYDRRMIHRLIKASPGLRLEEFAYFDCLGILLSLANRWITRRAEPTARDIMLWDKRILPLSRPLDRCLAYRVGKSFVAVACR